MIDARSLQLAKERFKRVRILSALMFQLAGATAAIDSVIFGRLGEKPESCDRVLRHTPRLFRRVSPGHVPEASPWRSVAQLVQVVALLETRVTVHASHDPSS